ncbi:MerR family transcriptional regulator [Mammaliicoccus sciuri]|uniref:MerR family transcriptional regulator n=2 Tax=Mammaliicoccus sciuri TaxID=1296 RepID=UPI0034DCE195
MAYTIKEAAAIVKLAPHTLRYYEEEKLISSVKRDENGYRIYTDEDLACLKIISCLRKVNVSITDIKEMMILSNKDEKMLSEQIYILKAHQRKLQKKQEELKLSEQIVSLKINHLKQLGNTDIKNLNKQKLC